MFARLLTFIQPAIEFIRQKYSDVQLIDAVKWGLIILFMIYIVSKISAVAVGIFAILLILFVAAKIYENYIAPKIKKKE